MVEHPPDESPGAKRLESTNEYKFWLKRMAKDEKDHGQGEHTAEFIVAKARKDFGDTVAEAVTLRDRRLRYAVEGVVVQQIYREFDGIVETARMTRDARLLAVRHFLEDLDKERSSE